MDATDWSDVRFGSIVRRNRLRDGHKPAQLSLRRRGGHLRAGLRRRHAQTAHSPAREPLRPLQYGLSTESALLTPETVPRSRRSGTRSPACSTGISWLRTTRHSTCRSCGGALNTTAISPNRSRSRARTASRAQRCPRRDHGDSKGWPPSSGFRCRITIRCRTHTPLDNLWLALPERFNTTHPELLARHRYRLGRCDLSAYRPYSNAQQSARGISRSFSAKDFTPRARTRPPMVCCTPQRSPSLAPWSACPGVKHSKEQSTPEPRPQISQQTHRLSRDRNDRPTQSRRNRTEQQAPQGLDLIAEGSQIQVIDEDQFVCLLAGTITRGLGTLRRICEWCLVYCSAS